MTPELLPGHPLDTWGDLGMHELNGLYESPYSILLTRLKSRGLALCPLSGAANNRTVLLRHDVEFDVHSAQSLAEIELEQGIKSTFLVAIRSPFFNVLDQAISQAIQCIAKMGHELGLHFIGDLDEPHLPDRIDRDLRLASDLFGTGDLNLVSYHAPGSLHRLQAMLPDSYLGLYRDIMSGDQKYVSDSGGTWQDDLSEATERPLRKGIHLLTHPVWWASIGASPYAKLCGLTALTSHMGPDPRLESFTPGLWRRATEETMPTGRVQGRAR